MLSYNSIHQIYGKMLLIQFSYKFKKSLKKNSNYFLRLFKPNKTVWYRKKMFIYGNCVTSIFFAGNNKNFSVIFKLPQFLNFFSTANRILYSNKHFPKKNCMQNLIFCVHNVVLDTQNLDFFFRFSGLKKS